MDFFAEKCSFCSKVRYYYLPENYRSEWASDLPKEVSFKEYQEAVCDDSICIQKSIRVIKQSNQLNGVEKCGDVIIVPRLSIRPFPNQPRKYFDKTRLKNLAESIDEIGQLVPVIVRELEEQSSHCYELIDGQRRWHACGIAGKEKMKAVVETVKDGEEQFTFSVIANFGREGHDPVETALAIKHFREKGLSVVKIAKLFSKEPGWVYSHYKILELDERVLQMMTVEIPEGKRLNFSTALKISDLPKDEHLGMAEKVVKGELKYVQAKVLVERKAEKLGIANEVSPRKRYQIVRNFSVRTERELEALLSLPQNAFDKMFEFRDSKDRKEVVQRVKKNISDLQILLKSLEK